MSDDQSLTADDIVKIFDLAPHPEGGFFKETFRDAGRAPGERAFSTAIYYLLRKEDSSAWHRVDASEVWHWYAGAPLELSIRSEGQDAIKSILGTDIKAGQVPQIVVPAHAWQSARPLGGWVLVGCTVAPGFEFEGFELLDDDGQTEQG